MNSACIVFVRALNFTRKSWVIQQRWQAVSGRGGAAVVEQGINITRTSPPNDRLVDEANLINPQIHHHHPRALSFYVYTYSWLFPAIIMHTQPRPVIYPSDRAHTHNC
jgi:hypothetical protein